MHDARVLVVDDSAAMRALFSDILEQAKNVRVVGTATNAADARDQILRSPKEPYTQRLIAAIPVPDVEVQAARRELRHELLWGQLHALTVIAQLGSFTKAAQRLGPVERRAPGQRLAEIENTGHVQAAPLPMMRNMPRDSQ